MELLKSKRFWSAIVGLVIIVISSINPDLRPHLDTIAPTVTVIIGVLIGGYSLEDVMLARNNTAVIEAIYEDEEPAAG